MICPVCRVDLKSSDLGEYGFVIIDVCPTCQGSWFDKGELDRLDESVWTDVEKAEFDNVGSDHKSVRCPKCDVELEPLSPTDAKTLIVDRCPSCLGFWLDRGELDRVREVADKDVSEILDTMKFLQRPPVGHVFHGNIFFSIECIQHRLAPDIYFISLLFIIKSRCNNIGS